MDVSPFATDNELWELTNYNNKFVRLQAFDLLLNFRAKKLTVLQILEKNKVDTLDKVATREGCLIYELTVFQRMVDMTKQAVEYAVSKNEGFFFGNDEERWKKIKASGNKD